MRRSQKAVLAAFTVLTAGVSPAFAGTNHHKPINVSADALTRGVVLSTLLRDLGVTPDKTGKDTFKDVSLKDWGYVNVAVEKGWVKPDSSTKFGINDMATVPWVDQLYWNYLGITHAQYQPGGYPWAWANVYGFNRALDPVANVTKHDLNQFNANLKALNQGWWYAGGTYHLAIRPFDVYKAFYNPRFPVSATTFGNIFATTVANMDQVTFRPEGTTFLVTLPSIPNSDPFVYNVGVTRGKLSYSFDGGQQWNSSQGFFTNIFHAGTKTWGDPYLSKYPVLVKVPVGSQFGIGLDNLPSKSTNQSQFGSDVSISGLGTNSFSVRELGQ